MYRIALATYGKYAVQGMHWAEDAWLKAELEKRGHTVEIIDWTNETFQPQRYNAIFVGTTWNVPSNPSAFAKWLQQCEADGVSRLINPRVVLSRGIKKYDYMGMLLREFGEVETAFGSIVPTRFYTRSSVPHPVHNLETVDGRTFEMILTKLDQSRVWGGQDVVIKPVVSADGMNTYVFHRSNHPVMANDEHTIRDVHAAKAIFGEILHNPHANGVILQVYMPAIHKGEYSLTFFDGQFSHAVQKPPGFRADRSAARRLRDLSDLPSGMVDFAQRTIQYICEELNVATLTRCRVDLFAGDEGPILSELEFVDPNMNIKIVEADRGIEARNVTVVRYADVIERGTRELATAAQHYSGRSG